MIPQRITVEGFLCYRTAQTIDLESAAVWMLAGPNGSGKSTTFDAITFALFGHHRGGQKNAKELINKASDRLLVEFDFLFEDRLYQARRTLKRKGSPAGTWQIRRWRSAAEPGWEEVPDTSTEVGFDRWVRNQLGLTYGTFTSSVLLLQGKADNLLAAVPAKRFEVLAGVVGLDRYQMLHERVETQRKELLNEGKTLLQQLNGVRVVEVAEVAEAEARIAAAEERKRSAQAEVECLQIVEFQAGRWAELQATLAAVRQEWKQAHGLLAQADLIDRDWSRLTELRSILPRVADDLEQRERLEQSLRESGRLAAERDSLAGRLPEAEYALDQVRQKWQALEGEFTSHAERRLELAEERQALSLALPLLRRFYRERDQLGEARRRARAAARGERSALVRVKQREAQLGPAKARWQAAAETSRQADHRVTRAGTLLDEVRKRAERFLSVVGEKMCRYCGQPLTPGHVGTEQAKLAKEQAEADERHRQALQAQTALTAEGNRLADEFGQIERLLEEARQQADDWAGRRKEAERDALHHAEECARAYAELTEAYRLRVGPRPPSDWLATTFPAADDLDAVERKHRQVAEEMDSLHRRGETLRREIDQSRQELARLTDDRDAVRRQVAEYDRLLESERLHREACQEILAHIEGSLPSEWRARLQSPTLAADAGQLQAEQVALEQNGTPALIERLQVARASVASLGRHKQDLEREQELFPEDARRDPAQVGELLRAARAERAAQETSLRQAQEHKAMLLLVRQQRERLHDQLLGVERQHKLYQKLAQLLGRDRLQLHLVRRAERGIVEYANSVLGRLSGRGLYLRLCGSEKGEDPSDKALQLEAINHAAGPEPIRVEFLSGSQRFRVAVSLALGIGQYASRQHRPVEAVIIDEGFGCLDRTNRQVMIQELQNLRGQLRRILVVSHQEEFATAFADGYHFELVNGATEVTRFQR